MVQHEITRRSIQRGDVFSHEGFTPCSPSTFSGEAHNWLQELTATVDNQCLAGDEKRARRGKATIASRSMPLRPALP